VAAALTADLGLPVEATAVGHYEELVARLMQGQVDIAVLPSVVYVRAREKMPCLGLAATMVGDGEVFYSGYLVARRDSNLAGSADLAGRRIGFVEGLSASGWLFPLQHLVQSGADPRKTPGNAVLLGDHLAVLRATIGGEVAAGASFYGAIQRARLAGLDVGVLRVIGLTGRIPYDAVVLRPGLEAGLAERVARALHAVNATTAEGRAALAPLVNIDGFVPSTDAHYEPVRRTLRALAGAPERP
jgi:phosphonate transport system substrate-binding protein